MTSTSHLNIINLQVQAEEQIAIDMANGTYSANMAADDKYYLWHGDYQTVPVNMLGDPELYASLLRKALPEVTTLRLPFNLNSFNADGSLHPEYERFLEAAAKEGFTFIMVQMEGDAQRLTAEGPDAIGQMRDALSGRVYDTMEQAWTKMLDWMDAHPSVKEAVYAHEIVNEPASYNQATFYASHRPAALQEFVSMYAEHMVQLGQMIDERSDAKVMVGGWNYSAKFQELADVAMGNGSALDFIRAGLGDSLVWSAHLYPGWQDTTGMSNPDDVRAVLDRIYGPVLGDSLILTETNAQGNEAYNLLSDRKEVQGFTQSYDWFADHGVAVTWFTGSQYGASNLSRMDDDGTLRFVQQASYGAAMDAFSLGGEDPAHAAGETIEAHLIAGKLRNQTNDPDYNPQAMFDVAKYLGLGLGHGGNDTLKGHAEANNFLYGGTGDDMVLGNQLDDFLYGQDGNDTVNGGVSGHDHLFGGRGNDRIIGGAGISQMYGGAGGDTFVVHPKGKSIIVDYSPSAGDFLIVADAAFTAADFRAQARSIDWDGSGAADLCVTLPGGGEIIILAMGDRIEEVLKSLLPAEGNVDPVEPPSEHETLIGGIGSDTIYGGAGNDIIYGDPEGAAWNDFLYGGTGDDRLYGGGGHDRLEGGDGKDKLYGGNGDDLLYGGKHNDVLRGEAGNDRLYGENGNDVLHGDGGLDALHGGGGNDKLYGGDGDDVLYGDGGKDQLFGGNGLDVLRGGNGDDILHGNESSDKLYGDKGRDTLYGGGGQDDLYGGTEDDKLYGEDGDDRLYGEDGNDVLNGGANNDLLSGGNGNDRLHGDIGKDQLYGDAGDDHLHGGDSDDVLHGGTGNDFLFGDAGNDWISGGTGHDIASGGLGKDTFVFNHGDDTLRITDFSTSQGDILRIDASLLGGQGSLAALQSLATKTDAGTMIGFDSGDSILLENFHGALSASSLDFF